MQRIQDERSIAGAKPIWHSTYNIICTGTAVLPKAVTEGKCRSEQRPDQSLAVVYRRRLLSYGQFKVRHTKRFRLDVYMTVGPLLQWLVYFSFDDSTSFSPPEWAGSCLRTEESTSTGMHGQLQ
jgi:hypothetical protein